MKGYYKKPEATAEVIDNEGWFHTGDIGTIEDGFLRITDRKKDIIVTAGGKNIVWPDRRQLLAMPTIQKKMEKEVAEQLHGFAHFEVPKKIGLLEHDFSIERGELTPKLSVKRKVVDKSYKDVIDSLYAGEHDGKM